MKLRMRSDIWQRSLSRTGGLEGGDQVRVVYLAEDDLHFPVGEILDVVEDEHHVANHFSHFRVVGVESVEQVPLHAAT